jgi:hypothetical protein
MAVADAGTVYVSQPAKTPSEGRPPMVELSGLGAVTDGTLAVLGDSTHVIAAQGPAIAVWDTAQLSRIGTRASATVPPNYGGACRAPLAAVRPATSDIALVPCSGQLLVDHPWSATRDNAFGEVLPIDQTSYTGSPVWTPDGSRLIAVKNTPTLEVRDGAVPDRIITSWPLEQSDFEWGVADITAPDNATLILVTGAGVTQRWRLRDGRLLGQLPLPAEVTGGSGPPHQSVHASIAQGGQRVAISGEKATVVVDLASGKTVGVIPVADAGVSLGRDVLAVSTQDEIQRWTTDGTRQLGSFPLPLRSYQDGPILNARGDLLIGLRHDGRLDLLDTASGIVVGTLDIPAEATSAASDLVMSRDGSRAITVTEGTASEPLGTIQSWSVDPDRWRQSSCSAAGQDIGSLNLAAITGVTSLPTIHC